jgi:hypothetical protein
VRFARNLLALVLLATLGLSAAEQRGEVRLVKPPAAPIKFSAPWRPAGSTATETRVVGTVIDIRQVPVSYAKVQLRDLKTGLVLASDDTNDMGEYEFDVAEPGTYVVEMVMVDNYVLALSNAGSLARYETLQTVIQLPGRWDAAARSMFMPVAATAFFGIGSINSMTSTTIALAGDQDIRPVDAGESVSPNNVSTK